MRNDRPQRYRFPLSTLLLVVAFVAVFLAMALEQRRRVFSERLARANAQREWAQLRKAVIQTAGTNRRTGPSPAGSPASK
jgi:hypothetical protein